MTGKDRREKERASEIDRKSYTYMHVYIEREIERLIEREREREREAERVGGWLEYRVWIKVAIWGLRAYTY